MITAMATNNEGDTGRFKMLADWGHDPEPAEPTFSDMPHGFRLGSNVWCTPCGAWMDADDTQCAVCSSPWVRT